MALKWMQSDEDSDNNVEPGNTIDIKHKRFVNKVVGQNNANLKRWSKAFNVTVKLNELQLEITGSTERVKRVMEVIQTDNKI